MTQGDGHFPLVHQIWFTFLPEQDTIPPNCQKILDLVGQSRYRLWTLASAREFLLENFEGSVVSAFDRLKPLAYKSDLFRFCVILKLGGYYLDLAVTDPRLPDVADYDFIGFCDLNNENSSWKIQNGYFYARAGSIILQDAIQQVVDNGDREYYGKDAHFPTGPSVLGRSVAKLSLELKVLMGHYHWHRRRRNKYLLPGQVVVGRGKIGGKYRESASGIPGGNNYRELWRDRDVYEGKQIPGDVNSEM
ncbi:MAG: glycosyltransferase [Nitrososphaerales archaeon]